MKKVVSPCFCKVYTRRGNEATARAFCKIQFENGRLSITGVIGPMPSGNCSGGAGQCVDAIREGHPCDKWTRDKLAVTPVTLYHYRLNSKTLRRQESMKKSSWKMLCDGMTAALNDNQIEVAKLPYSLTLPHEISGDAALYYEPQKPLYPGMAGATETKALGWLHPEEHPDGILGKPCPVCGYKYGHSWLTEEVPQDVIDWLCSLPESPVEPAWV